MTIMKIVLYFFNFDIAIKQVDTTNIQHQIMLSEVVLLSERLHP